MVDPDTIDYNKFEVGYFYVEVELVIGQPNVANPRTWTLEDAGPGWDSPEVLGSHVEELARQFERKRQHATFTVQYRGTLNTEDPDLRWGPGSVIDVATWEV
jgi:hypothetical protein